jgi:hypothetical protein
MFKGTIPKLELPSVNYSVSAVQFKFYVILHAV